MKNKILIILLSLSSFIACDKNDDNDPKNCDKCAIISPQLYATAPNDELVINSLVIKDDSLIINFSASGCSGSSWALKLIDSGDILESDPPQRNLRLSLKNDEMCEAFITKELAFCISNLRVGGDRVKLNLDKSDEGILYEY